MPAFNEEENLPVLVARIAKVSLGEEIEMVVVDDGSTDATPAVIESLSRAYRFPVRGARHARNFGSHAAIATGLEMARGGCAVIMAADLQDPPEVLPALAEAWRAGHEIVWARRRSRKDAWPRVALSRVFYWLVRKYALPNYPPGGTGSFCLVDRKAIDAYRSFAERNRLTFGIFSWMGFRSASVEYDRAARRSGHSKWTISMLAKGALDTFLGFSYAPVRLIAATGVLLSILAFLAVAWIVFSYFYWGYKTPGWGSIFSLLLFVSGVQFLFLGILGEYLWRILDEVRARPIAVVEKRWD